MYPFEPYISIALGVLLLASEVLPFIKSNDYNGFLHWVAHKLYPKKEGVAVDEESPSS
jgi:hypothetical protein